MFKIKLKLNDFGFLTGLRALDERRRLGLPDDAKLSFDDVNPDYVTADVDEKFARTWFHNEETVGVESVCLNQLVSGEVRHGTYICQFAIESPDRIRELWTASRAKRLALEGKKP